MNPSVAVIIPAGGSGSRLDKKNKKQFFRHKGESLLWWSIQPFYALKENLYKIIVAIPDQLSDEEKECLPQSESISYCIGGATRQESVMNGLEKLAEQSFGGTCIVHDAARPCLNKTHLIKMVEKIDESNEGAMLCVKVSDTVKRSNNDLNVVATVDRSNLWLAQTPQGAPFEKLYRANQLVVRDKVHVTDDASILEYAEIPVHIVEDSKKNRKITCREDWSLFTEQN